MRKSGPLHLEIQCRGKRFYGVIRSSFREAGKVRHTNHGRLSGLSFDQLKLIQAAFRGDVVPSGDRQALELLGSREYGASAALMALAAELGLGRAIYSRPEQWVKDCQAMIVGRLVCCGSKLKLSQQWINSALWELCGVKGPIDVDRHCYEPMDRLLTRQKAIQRHLAEKHLKTTTAPAVLYDITSSYMEGEYKGSSLVAFGHNRDGKKGHEQIVIGLVCSAEGCPVAVEVFRGNTQDAATVGVKITELQKLYGLKELVFVGDRGMVTRTQSEQLRQRKGISTISALTHAQIVELLDHQVIQMELFDQRDLAEVRDPQQPGRRYVLCRNPQTQAHERRKRAELMEATRQRLDKIVASSRRAKPERLGSQVGRVLEKYRMGKFVEWEIKVDPDGLGRLHWQWNQQKIEAEERFDGCYIVVAEGEGAKSFNAAELVETYKNLLQVEQAFRNLKTVQLEVRPVYHQLDERIRCHVFICMLAYYLQWHMMRRLQPLLEKDGEGKQRRWTVKNILERLKGIRRERVRLNGIEFEQNTLPDEDQQRILDLLGVKL